VSPLDTIREHAKQQELTNSSCAIRAFLAGNRVGKTKWGGHETGRFLHKKHPVIPFDEAPMEIWAACPSFDVQKDTNQPAVLKLLGENRIVDKTWLRKGVLSEILYRADDDTIGKITFKSYEQGREKFQGAGKKLIWFDEEPPRDIWEECFVRVAAGQKLYVILTMTPVNGMTWVYDDLYLNTSNPDIKVITAGWDDNPWLTEEQKAQMGRGLTEEALQVRKYGKFMRRTGLVCPWWDRTIHLKEIEPRPEWDVYRAIDFGFSNPACVLYIGVDYDDNWHIFDGLYQTQLTTPQLAQAIKRKDVGRRIQNCWADSAAASDIKELQDERIDVSPVEKHTGDSKEGWDEFRARRLMEQGKVQGNGKPKIFVDTRLTWYDEKRGKEINWFVDEVEHLRWDEKERNGEKTQQPRWAPGPNHAIDALTYFMVSYKGDVPKRKPSVPLVQRTRDPYEI